MSCFLLYRTFFVTLGAPLCCFLMKGVLNPKPSEPLGGFIFHFICFYLFGGVCCCPIAGQNPKMCTQILHRSATQEIARGLGLRV